MVSSVPRQQGGEVVCLLTAWVLCQAKNAALRDAGAVVPDSFEAFEGAIKATYDKLVVEGKLVPQPDVPPPSVPMDLEAAKKAGKVTAMHLAGDVHKAEDVGAATLVPCPDCNGQCDFIEDHGSVICKGILGWYPERMYCGASLAGLFQAKSASRSWAFHMAGRPSVLIPA